MFTASEESIDDLMRAIFKKLLSTRGNHIVESQKGISTEVFGALLELKNPRARLSRSFSRAKAFSPLGELFWYLAGDESVEFITHYIPTYHQYSNDGKKAKGAYGPRIFGPGAKKKISGNSEWDRALRTLKNGEGSRNAVIQIFENKDAKPRNKDRPCTCTIQFAIRERRLFMHTHMRSNDAFLGLPHDVFSFTMLQEIAARELDVGLGQYTHSVASLHLYHDKNTAKKTNQKINSNARAQAYFDEGVHEFVPMPAMPKGDPWNSISLVKDAEKAIRLGDVEYQIPAGLDQYWVDLIQLFRIHKIFNNISTQGEDETYKSQNLRTVINLMYTMHTVYRIYIMDRLNIRTPLMRDLFEHAEQGK